MPLCQCPLVLGGRVWAAGPFWVVRRCGGDHVSGQQSHTGLFRSMTGAMEIPAYFFMCLCLERVGRRYTMASCLLLASFISAVYVVAPRVSHSIYLWNGCGSFLERLLVSLSMKINSAT